MDSLRARRRLDSIAASRLRCNSARREQQRRIQPALSLSLSLSPPPRLSARFGISGEKPGSSGSVRKKTARGNVQYNYTKLIQRYLRRVFCVIELGTVPDGTRCSPLDGRNRMTRMRTVKGFILLR